MALNTPDTEAGKGKVQVQRSDDVNAPIVGYTTPSISTRPYGVGKINGHQDGMKPGDSKGGCC